VFQRLRSYSKSLRLNRTKAFSTIFLGQTWDAGINGAGLREEGTGRGQLWWRPLAGGQPQGVDWGKTVRCVRINDVSTQWCHDDIISIVEGVRENVDTIMLTKPFTASDVLFVDKLLSQLEKKFGLKKRIGLECHRAGMLGMVGKWAIHPSQIAPVQDNAATARLFQNTVDRAELIGM
jgi:citrate lyase beta subunit